MTRKTKILLGLTLFLLLTAFMWPVIKPYLGYNANELIVEVEKPLEQSQLSIEKGFFSDLKASKEDLLRKKHFLVYDGKELQQIRNDYGENDFLLKYADTCYVLFRHFKTNNKQRDNYHFQVYKKGANIYLKASIVGTDPRSFTRVFKSIEKIQATNTLTTLSHNSTTLKKEDWIYDTIYSLEEVKKENAYLVKQTKGERNLSVVIYAYPTTTNNYYWVKVWEDNGDAYASHFNFHVYPKTRKIMYYDVVKDSMIELKDWKKNSKYFNFK